MDPVIRLRDVEVGDLRLFFEHQQDPVAVAMVAFLARPSRVRPALGEGPRRRHNPEEDLHSGRSGSRKRCSWTSERKREVGYWIDRAFWGRGVATAALTAFLTLEKTRPLDAGVAKHNAASIRVLQKCGFTLSSSGDEHFNDASVMPSAKYSSLGWPATFSRGSSAIA